MLALTQFLFSISSFHFEMEDLIIVTGYGQFYGHKVNASGEAVKLLPREIAVGPKKYEIRTMEVSVEYEDVDKKVVEIWKQKPFLVVHCGEREAFHISLLYRTTLFIFRRSRSCGEN